MHHYLHKGSSGYTDHSEGNMIAHLFFQLLPVQVAIVAMGSINAIVDGVIAARCIDSATVGVVGLYYTVLRVLEAVGSVLLGGLSVLSGRYLGSGRIDRTQGVCSLSMTMALLVGIVLTSVSFLVPGRIAVWLGANDELKEALTTYILGYAIGIAPQLLAQQLTACLQLERQDRRNQLGIVVMISANVILDILFVTILKMGVWGLSLATSLANWAHFLVLSQYYFTDKVQLKPSSRLISWRELPALLQIGCPNALLVACLAGRSLVINRVLLSYAGQDGLSALSAFNMISGLLMAVALGAASVVRMLSSVFIGEENREGILGLMRVVLTRVMAMILGITAAVVLLSPVISGIFFPDRASKVFNLTKLLIIMYGGSLPVILLLTSHSNFFQAAGHRLFVNLVSLTDGFFSVVIPALLLAPKLGAVGVWLAFPIGLIITSAVSLAYTVIRCKGWPTSAEAWLLLQSSFDSAEHLVLELRDIGQVTDTSVQVQSFCEAHGLSRKKSTYTALCLEEMAGNIIQHGFRYDKKTHVIELRVVIRPNDVILRIKDDCIPFNPSERYRMMSGEDPLANIGIRLVYGIADEMTYQNLLGLNVLTINFSSTPGI